MFLSNLHTHTWYSDGGNTPEEYIEKAISLGFTSIGFSEHSPTFYKSSWEILAEDVANYLNEINGLKEKYKGQIEVVLGMEEDINGPIDRNRVDYVIGAVHCLESPKEKGNFIDVDHNHDYFKRLIDHFDGIENVCREFYGLVNEVIKTKPDILAHFDLITKFNGDGEKRFFDDDAVWYRNLVNEVCDNLKDTGIIVEINTGAISRGHRVTPYPSSYILERLFKNKVPITISADAHQAVHLDFGFEEAVELAKKASYTHAKIWSDGGFVDCEI